MDVIFVQFKPSNNTDISDSFWELLEFEASTIRWGCSVLNLLLLNIFDSFCGLNYSLSELSPLYLHSSQIIGIHDGPMEKLHLRKMSLQQAF